MIKRLVLSLTFRRSNPCLELLSAKPPQRTKLLFLTLLSYLLQNFNDFASGMVTLFDLLIMGNWQSWMEVSFNEPHWISNFDCHSIFICFQFVAAFVNKMSLFYVLTIECDFQSYVTLTGKWWTVFYFWSFYVIAVLFLLNLVCIPSQVSFNIFKKKKNLTLQVVKAKIGFLYVK